MRKEKKVTSLLSLDDIPARVVKNPLFDSFSVCFIAYKKFFWGWWVSPALCFPFFHFLFLESFPTKQMFHFEEVGGCVSQK